MGGTWRQSREIHEIRWISQEAVNVSNFEIDRKGSQLESRSCLSKAQNAPAACIHEVALTRSDVIVPKDWPERGSLLMSSPWSSIIDQSGTMSLRSLFADEEAVPLTPPSSWSILTGIIMPFSQQLHVLRKTANYLIMDYGRWLPPAYSKDPCIKTHNIFNKTFSYFFRGKTAVHLSFHHPNLIFYTACL